MYINKRNIKISGKSGSLFFETEGSGGKGMKE